MLEKTQNPNDSKTSNLWLGFAFGSIIAGSLAFLIGTKKGREILKKLLDLTENFEENISMITQEIEKTLDEKTRHINNEQKKEKLSLSGLLDKIKILDKPDLKNS